MRGIFSPYVTKRRRASRRGRSGRILQLRQKIVHGHLKDSANLETRLATMFLKVYFSSDNQRSIGSINDLIPKRSSPMWEDMHCFRIEVRSSTKRKSKHIRGRGGQAVAASRLCGERLALCDIPPDCQNRTPPRPSITRTSRQFQARSLRTAHISPNSRRHSWQRPAKVLRASRSAKSRYCRTSACAFLPPPDLLNGYPTILCLAPRETSAAKAA